MSGGWGEGDHIYSNDIMLGGLVLSDFLQKEAPSTNI